MKQRCCWARSLTGAERAPPAPASGRSYSVITPTYYFGQGFGQLPGHRRLAAAGGDHRSDRLPDPDQSYDATEAANIPQVLVYGASLQYSMPYLKSEVKDLQLPNSSII